MKGIEWDCKGLESIAEEAIKEKSDLSLKAIQDKKKYSALMQLRIKCCKKLLLLDNYHNLYQTTYLFLNKCLVRNILKNYITKYLIYTVKYIPISRHIWCCHDYILYFGEYE